MGSNERGRGKAGEDSREERDAFEDDDMKRGMRYLLAEGAPGLGKNHHSIALDEILNNLLGPHERVSASRR